MARNSLEMQNKYGTIATIAMKRISTCVQRIRTKEKRKKMQMHRVLGRNYKKKKIVCYIVIQVTIN